MRMQVRRCYGAVAVSLHEGLISSSSDGTSEVYACGREEVKVSRQQRPRSGASANDNWREGLKVKRLVETPLCAVCSSVA